MNIVLKEDSFVLIDKKTKYVILHFFFQSIGLLRITLEFRFPRTQNNVEAWQRRWSTLIGWPHVALLKIIREINKEQNETEIQFEKMIRGIQDPNTIRRQDAIKKETLQRIIAHRQEYETNNRLPSCYCT